jgi:hypothetical protein
MKASSSHRPNDQLNLRTSRPNSGQEIQRKLWAIWDLQDVCLAGLGIWQLPELQFAVPG